jgi:hypothetical protein
LDNNGPASLLVDAPAARDAPPSAAAKDGISIKLADVLTIIVQVDGSTALEVKPPDKITNSPGWRLVEALPAATTELDKERRRWRRSYTLEPLIPGALPLQIEPLLFRDNGAPFRKIAWNPVPVRVLTSITTPDLKSLRDPTVIEPLSAPAEAWPVAWLWLGSGVLMVSVAALSYLWWRRRRRPAPMPAQQRALRELERVLALRLPDQGKIDRFHALLANVVRRYLERRFQLPARRRTTREFLEVLKTSEKLSGTEQEFLRDFLPRCDLAKFARADAVAQECLKLAGKVRAFIQGHGDNGPRGAEGLCAPCAG